MRRFELWTSDPPRFWEPAADGASIRSGVIGTPGRRVTIAPERRYLVKAWSAIEAMVREGYVEVGDEGVPAEEASWGPVVQPAPVGADDPPPFAWTPGLRARGRLPFAAVEPLDAWRDLRALVDAHRTDLSSSGRRLDWPVPDGDAIDARLASPSPVAGPPVEDAAWATLAAAYHLDAAAVAHPRHVVVVRAWIAVGGLDHAVACARHLADLVHAAGGPMYDHALAVIVPLRAALDASPAAHERARSTVAGDLNHPNVARALVAACLTDEVEVDRLAARVEHQQVLRGVWTLLASPSCQAAQLRSSNYPFLHDDPRESRAALWSLAARLGPAAIPDLASFHRRAFYTEERLYAAEILAFAGTTDALEALAGDLTVKLLAPIARQGLLARPRAALDVLRRVRGQGQPAAEGMIATIVAARPDLASPAARPAADDARRDDWPAVLRDPPWRQPRPPEAPALTLTARPTVDRYIGEVVRPAKVRDPVEEFRYHRNLPFPAAALRDPDEATLAAFHDYLDAKAGCYLVPQSTRLPLPVAVMMWGHPKAEIYTYIPPSPADIAALGMVALPALLRLPTANVSLLLTLIQPFDVAAVAPIAARAAARTPNVRAKARAWLRTHVDTAVAALLPAALGPSGDARFEARSALRYLMDLGHTDAVHAEATHHGAEHALRAWLDRDPLFDLPKKIKEVPRHPAITGEPPIRLKAGGTLPLEAVDALLTMLSFYDLSTPYAGMARVQEACTPESLSEFGWWLFSQWLADGAAGAEGWRYRALAVLGDHTTPGRLDPLLRAWPLSGHQNRAVVGLDLLAHLGSDAALRTLQAIATKTRTKALQERARERIDDVAAQLGLTADELGDRLVPDLDLDLSGRHDLGEGGWYLTLADDLTVTLRDADGRVYKALPAARADEDAPTRKATAQRLTAFKKALRDEITRQSARLEAAMVAGRAWNVAVFREHVIDHPLMRRVARALVWSNDGGSLFRVAEDGSVLDAQDQAFTLPDDASVHLPHPVHLEAHDVARWGRHLTDDRLIQPFPQLSRTVHRLSREEAASASLSRFHDLPTTQGKLRALEARGWRRAAVGDGGFIDTHELSLPDGRTMRLLLDPGYPVEGAFDGPPPAIGSLHLSRGSDTLGPSDALDTLTAVQQSELVAALLSLTT